MKNQSVIIIAVIALLVGAAIAWVAKPTGVVEEEVGKFAEAPPAGETITLIHGLDAAYPPWTQVTEAGEIEGFDVDMVIWIRDWLNENTENTWVIEHKPYPWEGIFVALKEGKLDLIASGATIIAEEQEIVLFGMPYFSYHMNIVVAEETTLSWEEILKSGESLACQLGTDSEIMVDQLIEEGHNVKKLALESYPLALEAIKAGRAIAGVSDSAVTVPLFKKPQFAGLKELTAIGGPKVFSVATKWEDRWLYEQINYAIYDFMGSPEYREYLLKWEII